MALLAAAVAVVPGTSVSQVSAACTLCAGGEYHTVAPIRIFDSRSIYADPLNPDAPPTAINDVTPLGRKPLAQSAPTFSVDLLGLGNANFVNPWLPDGVISSDVLAVVASVTIVAPNQKGHVRAYATGSPSTTAILNFRALQNVPNLAVLRPNASGQLTFGLFGAANGSADIVVDVYGWFSTSTYVDQATGEAGARGARLFPVDPARILDTRDTSSPIGDGATIDLQVRGKAPTTGGTVPVPADTSIVGVVLNVTAVRPSGNTFVSVLPASPSGIPTTSNLNVTPTAVKANLVIVPLSADGHVFIYNHRGNTNVVVDVMGYLKDGELETTRKGRVIPLTTPFRAFDTLQVPFGGVPLGPAQSEDWSFASFAGSVNVGGVSVGNQMGLLGNLTNRGLARQNVYVSVEPSYLAVYPTPATPSGPPLIANLNSVEDSGNPLTANPVPNMALVKYGANQTIRVFNLRGYAHYLLDVSAVVLND